MVREEEGSEEEELDGIGGRYWSGPVQSGPVWSGPVQLVLLVRLVRSGLVQSSWSSLVGLVQEEEESEEEESEKELEEH